MYTDEWSTPNDFFDKLNNIYNFNLDPCSTHDNHKTDFYYTKEMDGLKHNWSGFRVFCNPPYSKIKEWVKKCFDEYKRDPNTLIVLLIPARTDTKYFHDYILNHADIHFVKGRLRFGGSCSNAPFPSIYCVYNDYIGGCDINVGKG